MDSCFVLIETHQYCIAKICNASPRANAHKLQNDPFTISSSVPWTHLRPETRAATSRVSRRKETECHDWCLEKAKLNVVGQDQQCQPKHLTVRTTPCLKGAQRIVSALQSIVCHYIFLLRSLEDPTLAAFFVCGPLQFLVTQITMRLTK